MITSLIDLVFAGDNDVLKKITDELNNNEAYRKIITEKL
jgi:hypothetical protein